MLIMSCLSKWKLLHFLGTPGKIPGIPEIFTGNFTVGHISIYYSKFQVDRFD